MIILTTNPIKNSRLTKRLEQSEVAKELSKLLKKEIRQKDVSRWELTKTKPNKDTILAMSLVFNKDPIKFYNDVQQHFETWRELENKAKERRESYEGKKNTDKQTA